MHVQGFGGGPPVYGVPPQNAPTGPRRKGPGKDKEPEKDKDKKAKKEKPQHKLPIPDTPWVRVITNLGNKFYTNSETKTSVWTVPDEIKDRVAQIESEEKEEEERKRREEDESELKRVKEEAERDKEARERKRKVEEEGESGSSANKKARLSTEPEAGGEREDAEMPDAQKGEEEDEESWQREMAAQMAAEAEAEDRKEAVQTGGEKQARIPAPSVDPGLTQEEAKAVFKVWRSYTPDSHTCGALIVRTISRRLCLLRKKSIRWRRGTWSCLNS